MSKLSRKLHIKNTPLISLFNTSAVRAMSDAETLKRAKNDPDGQPLTEQNIKQMKPIKKNRINL
ncbi:MAG: hypothetical protein L3K25_00920 [Gammaproteobacteria bacterium]|nr:hypothetical protein [Gammaproteobacteria bacterium]